MFRKLLVPLDQSSIAEQALVPAASIARATKARLDVMTVHPRRSPAQQRWSSWVAEQTRDEQDYVERIAERLAAHELIGTTFTVMEGDVVDCICARALHIGAGMIVMMSHGRTGIDRLRLGSIADGLIRKSPIPVLMMRASHVSSQTGVAHTPFRRILLPLDGSSSSNEVFESALELARGSAAQLVLLRIVQPVPLMAADIAMTAASLASSLPPFLPSAMQDIEATERLCASVRAELAHTAKLLNGEGVTSIESHVVVANHVGSAIADFATTTGADIVAMTSHGSGMSRWLLGSVTDDVMQRTTLPLLVTGQPKVIRQVAEVRAPVSTPRGVAVPA